MSEATLPILLILAVAATPFAAALVWFSNYKMTPQELDHLDRMERQKITRAGSSYRGGSPDTQTPRERETSPNPGDLAHTRPPLSQLPAMLLRPLTREGRLKLPLYYLVRKATRIAPAPTGAPLSEKMRRRFEGAAIALWWPIGKALTLFWLWHEPPCHRTVLEWWRVQNAVPRSHTQPLQSMKFEGPSLSRDRVPQSSIAPGVQGS